MLVVDAMEAALAAVEENRRVPACRSGKQWRVLKMLSGRRRHRSARAARGSAVSAGVSSSLLLQKTGEKPIEGPTKRPSTGSIEERAAPALLPLQAGALAELVVGILSTVRKLESEDRCPNLLPKDRPLALGRGHVTVSIGAAWLVPRD